MIKFNLDKLSPFILDKIHALCHLLWQGKNEFEALSSTIPDKQLRWTVLALAQESNQYASELSSQLHTLAGISVKEVNGVEKEEDDGKANITSETLHNETEVLALCRMNENKIVRAYQDILNESFLLEGLRKMLRYQLNGVLCAFMQLKLLNSLNFR